MRVCRLIIALPLVAIGAFLALASLMIGCTNLAASSPERAGVLLLTGLPTSLGEWVTGALGLVLLGLGWAIASGTRTPPPPRH